jgi:hypothetical protein
MVYKPTYMKSRDMPNMYFNYKGINPVHMNTNKIDYNLNECLWIPTMNTNTYFELGLGYGV